MWFCQRSKKFVAIVHSVSGPALSLWMRLKRKREVERGIKKRWGAGHKRVLLSVTAVCRQVVLHSIYTAAPPLPVYLCFKQASVNSQDDPNVDASWQKQKHPRNTTKSVTRGAKKRETLGEKTPSRHQDLTVVEVMDSPTDHTSLTKPTLRLAHPGTNCCSRHFHTGRHRERTPRVVKYSLVEGKCAIWTHANSWGVQKPALMGGFSSIWLR